MQTAMPRVAAGQSGTSEHELRKRFSAVSGWRGGLDLLGHWLAIVAVAWAATTVGHWAGYVVAAIIIAGLQHGLINLTHEAWHRLCFRNKRVNDVVGAWFYCYPVGMPYYHDRRRHWDHHRLIGRHDDPDWINYSNDGRVPASRLLLFLGGRLLGSQLVVSVYNLLINRRARIEVQPASRDQRLPSPAAELVRVVACQVGLIGFFTLIGPWWAYLVLWVWPLTGPASVFIAIRAFAEHASEDDDAPVDERLYDFSPNPLEAFFLSPCHFNYHALHHAYPAVPHYRLCRFQQALSRSGVCYTGRRLGGYMSYLFEQVRGPAAPVEAAGVAGTHGVHRRPLRGHDIRRAA